MFATPSAALQAARREEIIVEPDSERSRKLQATYQEIYRDLYVQLRTAHHRLYGLRQ
jgi:sugar (pentulose or hexulose) kinase